MLKLICRFLGHCVDVTGVTGKYRWCSRCATRFENNQD